MRIQGWRIDGFGIFRNWELHGLDAGLNVFQGPNEAGKSTLLAFLRGMLFGFPARGPRGALYPPPAGGAHGGALWIEHDGEELRIERRVGGLEELFIGERPAELRELRDRLASIDEGVFQSVFAFGLAELQAFHSLSGRDIQERIYSALVAGASRSGRAALEKLSREARSILPERGPTVLTELAREIEEVRRQLAAERRELARHDELAREGERLREEARALERRGDEVRSERDELELLVALWPLWREISRLRQEVEALGPDDDLPEDSDARLAELGERARSAAAEAGEDRKEKVRLEARREAISVRLDERLFAARDALESLFERIPEGRRAREELAAAEREEDAAGRRLAASLRRTGPDWSEERLAAFDPQDRLAGELAAWRETLEESRSRLADARRRFVTGAAEVKKAAAEKERLSVSLAASPPPALHEIDALERAVREGRIALSELAGERAGLESARRLLQTFETAADHLRAKEPWSPPAAALYASVTLAAGALAVALWRGAAGDTTAALALLLASATAAATAFVFRRLRREAETETRRRETELRSREAELREFRSRIRRHQERIRHLLEGLESRREATGAPAEELTFGLIEERTEDLRKMRRSRREWDARSERVEELKGTLRRLREEEDHLAAEVVSLRSREKETVDAWNVWKQGAGLEVELDGGAVAELLDAAAAARHELERLQGARERRAEASVRLTRWEEAARDVLERAGEGNAASLSGASLEGRLVAARDRLREDAQRRADLSGLDERLGEIRQRLLSAEDRRAAAEKARAELFARTEVEDESGLRQRREVAERRRRLRERLGAHESQLEERLASNAPPDAVDKVRDRLATGAIDEWRADLEAARNRLARLTEERDGSIRRSAEVDAARQLLAESPREAALELEEEARLTEVRDLLARWVETALARRVLAKTLEAYERERRPRVLTAASRVFANVTGERYAELVQSETMDDIVAVERSGGRKSTGELSRGTAEQLYLALRLALVREYARSGHVLPVVMDDVLVNFDPARARSMAEAVAELSREQQVFVFTCQPRTTELLLDARGGGALHSLGEPETGPLEPVLPEARRTRAVQTS